MSQIVVDEKVSAFFRQLGEPTRITDPQGRVLGIFTPSTAPAEEPQFDLEEAERILKEQGHLARPLPEIWRDIHAGRPVE